ncbi:MAG: homoserine O-acetyltransferase [Actinomycetota bacterium]
MSASIGLVQTEYAEFKELIVESGQRLAPVTLAYETYGELDEDKANAILIQHAFSGDAHAAGWHEGEPKPGWWEPMIGPGKAFDTNKYFVICSNVIGGCKGSTGPSSVNPATGHPYALSFPDITINDMAAAQKLLIDYLGIDRLLAVAGGSMGGQQALSWVARYPDRIKSAILIATAAKHSPQQIAFNVVGRQAILTDPKWNSGNYYDGPGPDAGLALARMVGHITYMSADSMEEKFGRKTGPRLSNAFSGGFEVEGYLEHQGTSFVERFDANSYLYLTKAIDSYDVSGGRPLADVFKGVEASLLVLAFKSDWLYPAEQSREIVKACKRAGVKTTFVELNSTYGHDAFLVEVEEETQVVEHFLERINHDNH